MIRNQDIKPKVRNTALETSQDEGSVSRANLENFDQTPVEPRAGMSRDAAEDPDEVILCLSMNWYTVLEDFHPALL